MPNNEPKVRTRTRTRGIGKNKITTTKTVTKQKLAPGIKYRKVDKTVSGPYGTSTMSKGKFKNMGITESGAAYDKPGKTKYKNSSFAGSSYNIETSRYKQKGPDKYKDKSYEETYKEKIGPESYRLGKKTISTPQHETTSFFKTAKERAKSTSGKGTVKQKGYISKETGGYDMYGKKLSDQLIKKSKTKNRPF